MRGNKAKAESATAENRPPEKLFAVWSASSIVKELCGLVSTMFMVKEPAKKRRNGGCFATVSIC
jgi:hypothetical protein